MDKLPHATTPNSQLVTNRFSSQQQSQRSPNQILDQWFFDRDWRPFTFQRQCWKAFQLGTHFLLHSSTGSGKTLAAWGGPLRQFLAKPNPNQTWNKRRGASASPPLTVLWITPLRALSADTESSLRQPMLDLQLPWTMETRTGDTSSSVKNRQRQQLPTALITTPESLSLLLSYPTSFEHFRHLRSIVVDEWHELLGTKRGIQTELALSRLRKIAPQAVCCGLSATLGNMDQALASLLGRTEYDRGNHLIIRGAADRKIEIKTLIPDKIDRFPWAGHLGLGMAYKVAAAVETGGATLVFTNTRNQAENWYRALLAHCPQWAGQLALHHGSLDLKTRRWVEQGIGNGQLKCVACTSSLDLGVDFSPVNQVIQVGSPKGVARLVQRAGRSGHQPDSTSRLYFVPTHAFEMVELAAAKQILKRKREYEDRPLLNAPLDCLAQHAVTLALAAPYTADSFAAEVRDCISYQALSDQACHWVLDYVHCGGTALRVYPDFHRVALVDGHYQVTDKKIARQHRISMGTITSDISVEVKFLNGQRLGTVEENFISRLKTGDTFQFAGKNLELFQLREGVALVRRSTKVATSTPRWLGGRLPLSTNMAAEVRQVLHHCSLQHAGPPELKVLKGLLDIQRNWSHIPLTNEVLIESFHQRSRYQLCLYPFEGRLVHEGLAALLAFRIGQQRSQTIQLAVNDYGLLLDSDQPLMLDADDLRKLIDSDLDSDAIAAEIEQCLNHTEMTKRQFREIAQIAGMIHPGYPGQPKRARHLQASSNMFYDALVNYDPQNLLLQQAKLEVLERQLQWQRMKSLLHRLSQSRFIWRQPKAYTPFAFPLIVERLRERFSNESLDQRVRKMLEKLNQLANEAT